jgi:hypothetical protein
LRELEAAAAAALAGIAGGKGAPPPEGSVCTNCGAALHGPFCHACGQSADHHKRNVFRLIFEGIESVFHLDGRIARTLPDLFFRPGRLARDLIEGRVARHIPPFRLFLVALLIWVFAAEAATHRMSQEGAAKTAAANAALTTTQGRAKAAAALRADAAKELASDLKEAAAGRDSELKDPDEAKAKVLARYQEHVGRIQASYADQMASADLVEKGQIPNKALKIDAQLGKSSGWLKAQLQKAISNPDYYLSVMFEWGHRVAFLLLPIVGLTLSVVYINKRRYFIYDHFLVAMNFLSFVFLVNAPGFLFTGDWAKNWFDIATLWTPINLFQTLRGAYGTGWVMALLRTFIVWITAVVWFLILVIGLMVFVLTQI